MRKRVMIVAAMAIFIGMLFCFCGMAEQSDVRLFENTAEDKIRDPHVRQVVKERFTYFALTMDDTLFVWGKDSAFSPEGGSTVPLVVANNVKDIVTVSSYVVYYTDYQDNLFAWRFASETSTDFYFHFGNGDKEYSHPIQIGSNFYAINLNPVYPQLWNGCTGYYIDKNHDVYEFFFGEDFEGNLYTHNKPLDSDINNIIENSYMGFNYAVKDDNSLWVWGNGDSCLSGNGNKKFTTPTFVLDDVKSVLPLLHQTYVLKNDNTLWGWGYNDKKRGYLGNSNGNSVKKPKKLMKDVDHIWYFPEGKYQRVPEMYATDLDGSIWGWRYSSILGDVQKSPSATIRKIMDGVGQIKDMSFSYFVTVDNKLYTYDNSGVTSKNLTVTPVFLLDGVDYVITMDRTDEDPYIFMLDGTIYRATGGDFTQLQKTSTTKSVDPMVATGGGYPVVYTDEQGNLYGKYDYNGTYGWLESPHKIDLSKFYDKFADPSR